MCYQWPFKYSRVEEVMNTFSEFVTFSKIMSLMVIIPESGEVHVFLPSIRVPRVFLVSCSLGTDSLTHSARKRSNIDLN